MSDLLGPRARRTHRLAEAQGRVGIACGGAPGARRLAHLRMPASRATVLRLVRSTPMPDAPAPTSIGVDDRAMRKGCSCGTIVVDLDRHRVVDLLPDRSAATPAGWPGRRTGGTCWPHGAQAWLRRLPSVAGSAPLPTRRSRAFARSASEREAGTESRARWKAVYDEVRRRRARGKTLLGIARDMDLARATGRESAAADTFPARLPHGPGPSLLDPNVDDLPGRIGEGCESAMALWREIRERGYPGTSRQVHRFVADRRTKPTRSGSRPGGEVAPMPETPDMEPSLPSARQPAWLLVQPTSALDAVAAAVVARVEQDAAAKAVADLARLIPADKRLDRWQARMRAAARAA